MHLHALGVTVISTNSRKEYLREVRGHEFSHKYEPDYIYTYIVYNQ